MPDFEMVSYSLRPHKIKDLTGLRFGRLLVIEQIPPADIYQPMRARRALWTCRCDCGKTVTMRGSDLTSKSRPGTKSCGCLRGRPFKGETMQEALKRRGLVIPDEEDPTPWCTGCGAMRQVDCHCGPLADND